MSLVDELPDDPPASPEPIHALVANALTAVR
jgi:hypothetical protein